MEASFRTTNHPDNASRTRLHRYAILVAVSAFLLVVAGASVSSNGAELPAAAWPLSFGWSTPETSSGIFAEHSHRVAAAAAYLLAAGLALWLWRAESGRWLCWLGAVALGAVILQGLLAGLTVLLKLPKAIGVAHACLAQIFFSATAAIAVFTSPARQSPPAQVTGGGSPPARSLALTLPAFLLAQIALGTAYRQQVLSVVPHMAGAMVVTVAVLAVCVAVIQQCGAHSALKRGAKGLMHITLFQVLVGTVAYVSRVTEPERGAASASAARLTVLHASLGALALAASVVLALLVLRSAEEAAAR